MPTTEAPRLILLNGPPAVGKSTLAQRFIADHPLTLNLDIDRVRSLLGRWRDDPYQAGLRARAIALAAARTHLSAGYDVVVPQLLSQPTFITQLAALAAEVGAVFHELVLLDTEEGTRRRFQERTRAAADPAHLEAHQLLERSGGLAELTAMYARLRELVGARPTAVVVPNEAGQLEQAYRAVLRVVAPVGGATGAPPTR